MISLDEGELGSTEPVPSRPFIAAFDPGGLEGLIFSITSDVVRRPPLAHAKESRRQDLRPGRTFGDRDARRQPLERPPRVGIDEVGPHLAATAHRRAGKTPAADLKSKKFRRRILDSVQISYPDRPTPAQLVAYERQDRAGTTVHERRADPLLDNDLRAPVERVSLTDSPHADRRLRVECEQASDDLVLEAGMTAAGYTTHLVEVLAAAQGGKVPPCAALAMARPNGFEDRVRTILDSERPRSRLAPRRRTLAALVAALLVLPLALVRLEARAHDRRIRRSSRR